MKGRGRKSMLSRILLVLICTGILVGCRRVDTQLFTGEVEILQSWQGDYPVDRLNVFPEGQRDLGIGTITDPGTFENVWKALKPDEVVPEIDFKDELVLFARNTQFFNRVRIGKVNVTNGVAEVLAMETLSAMPIEDKVAMSLAVVPRKGIQSIKTRDGRLSVTQ